MGFGYLLIGYLITFVLKITAEALQMGFVALLIGYLLMWFGLDRLKRYCRSFSFAQWTLYPLLLTAAYHGLNALRNIFLWQLPFLNDSVSLAVSWIDFTLLMLFHAALLSAVRELSLKVDLKKLANAALRNLIIVCLYAAVYLICALPIPALDAIRPNFLLSLTILNLLWVICNLFLLLSCMKNICPEGEENPEPVRYRWGVLNKLGDAFSNTFHKASERSRTDVETYLQKKQEKRQAKRDAEEAERTAHSKPHKKKKK